MNKKKIVQTLSALCCLTYIVVNAGGATYAEVSRRNDTTISNGIVSFSGRTDSDGKKVMYLVKPEGADDEAFEAIGELKAGVDGNFNIEFGLNNSGAYVIDITDADGDTYTEKINYITASDRQVQLLQDINYGTSARILDALLELNFICNETEFKSLSDEEKNWVSKYLQMSGPYSDMEEVEAEYIVKNFLYEINSAKVAGIRDKVKAYASFLEIADDDEVKKFIESSASYHHSALVSELHKNPAYTKELLVDAIKKANDAEKPTSSSGGGGGGGGGGASSRPVTSISVAPETETKPEAETTEKAEETKVVFTDMADAEWAMDAVETLYEKGVVAGDQNGNFRPNAAITRQEFVKMVVVAFDVEMAENNYIFLDVFGNDWYFEYVGAAYHAGIVKGISEDFFGINKLITRQDAAVILKRAAEYSGIELKSVRNYSGFNDSGEISSYAIEAVNALYESGVISGTPNGDFKPKDSCTRAEAAKMICGII